MNVSIRLLETREYSDIRTMNDNDHFRFQGQHFCKGKRKINAIKHAVYGNFAIVCTNLSFHSIAVKVPNEHEQHI